MTMKLGTETGSLINHLASRGSYTLPYVGCPVTMLAWTDRYPGTIVRMFKIGKADAFEVREDKWKRTDTNGFSENQTYDFERDPNGSVVYYKMFKGKWREVKKSPETGRFGLCSGGLGIYIGRREKYDDPTF